MICDRDIAELCVGIYAYPGFPGVTWDYFDDGADDGVCWGVKVIEDTDLIINRGSVTLEDWVRNAEALANPFAQGGLGPVHPGFFRGMPRQWGEVKARNRLKRRFAGHSQGAAHASILTGLAVLDGQMPGPRCVFGEPCPTFQQGAHIIAQAGGNSYRNGDGVHHDAVTSVPVRFWPELYVHASRLIDVSQAPADPRAPFAFHHMPLYQQALTEMMRVATGGENV